MPDYGHELRLGVFITPSVESADAVLVLAEEADALGLDLVSFQDHPYQRSYLDTWTLLSFVAARTHNVRLAPNVASLPLRPPAVLGKSVASLDRLSGGRVELGLGAGAFWDGIAAYGGRKLTPGQSVEALTEAIEVIRGIWGEGPRGERSVRVEGEHYNVAGAHPGPTPAHRVEIWLGAYKRRMLALTGRAADGWLPSMGYADPPELAAKNAAIDEAAEEAGRSPNEIRRLYNVNGSFGSGADFLGGGPEEWAQELAELTLAQGFSTYVLACDSAELMRRFAGEVAPALRELVEAGRERAAAGAGPIAVEISGDGPIAESGPGAIVSDPEAVEAEVGAAGRGAAGPFAVTPTPDDGSRHSNEQAWDEGARPSGPAPDPERLYTPDQQATGKHLIDVHDALRGELDQLRDLVAQIGAGNVDPQAVRSFMNRMTIRQNNWTLGVYCASYCRVVTGHHTLEDRSVFPHLKGRDPELDPVIDRLAAEHEVIAELLERIDAALTALVASKPDAIEEVRASVDLLTDAMVSHLSYEERELVEPLARFGFQ